jgi:hypothetical protein
MPAIIAALVEDGSHARSRGVNRGVLGRSAAQPILFDARDQQIALATATPLP